MKVEENLSTSDHKIRLLNQGWQSSLKKACNKVFKNIFFTSKSFFHSADVYWVLKIFGLFSVIVSNISENQNIMRSKYFICFWFLSTFQMNAIWQSWSNIATFFCTSKDPVMFWIKIFLL